MPATKHLLSSEAKVAHRHTALKKYAAKHKSKLRASAKERMQQCVELAWSITSLTALSTPRLRSKSPSQNQHKRQLASAATYRTKNRESIRASDTLQRAEKLIVKQHDDDTRKARALQEREHEDRARQPPSTPQPAPLSAFASRHFLSAPEFSSEESESDDIDSDSPAELPSESAISDRIFYGEEPRARSPTPDIFCQCPWPKYCPKCTCGCDYMCCLYHHEDESEYRRWMKELTCEERGLPSPYK
ncbi:hypothetical protein C8R43DRAFT_1045608 [Mycena crocata]|nr:hypothetical protein C8R43DRAFT_1045608 [Mycena crocata]